MNHDILDAIYARRQKSVRISRTKLLKLMPRRILEEMSQAEHPHRLSVVELIKICIEAWEDGSHLVKNELKRLFTHATTGGIQ